MIQIAIITETQKNELVGQLYTTDSYFNPIQDCNDNWIISTEEMDNSIYPQNEWVKTLSLIDWCAPIPTPSGSTENYVGS